MPGTSVSYDTLIEKVRQAEQALEARERTMSADWRQTRATWRAAWTPGRIVAAGAIAGFMFGRLRSKRAAPDSSGAGLIRLATSLIGLITALQAKSAAEAAEGAAESAEATATGHPDGPEQDSDAGSTAAATTPASRSQDRRRPDPGWHVPPRAAEAATEVSER